MPRGTPNNNKIVPPKVVEQPKKLPPVRIEHQSPSSWHIETTEEEGIYSYRNYYTNEVMRMTMKEFNAMINPKE
jgi:hypothetical protein